MADIIPVQHISLPPEVWHTICEYLEENRDLGSLFSTALVSKLLAGAAVKSLYRIHSYSPVISEGNEFEIRPGGQTHALQEQVISKWSLLWRSIMLSSLGKTMHPYCRYIKSLDLRNLTELFENGIFRDSVQDSFFTEEIAAAITSTNSNHVKRFGKQSTRRQNLRFNADLSREVFGESIIKHVHEQAQRDKSVVSIEELSGKIPANFLLSWCGRLARLKTLTLYEGSSLSKDIGRQIRENCPNFESLSIYSYLGNSADNNLSEFFDNLRPNSLSYFEMIHSNDIHKASFSSLSKHSDSLGELKLSSLKSNAIVCLGLLKDCKNLTTLVIQDREGRVDLENAENDILLEVVSWLKGCRKLENLTIDNFFSGVRIAVPVLLDESIKLKKFEIILVPSPPLPQGVLHIINLQGHQDPSPDLYSALAHQTGLEELKLRGDGLNLETKIDRIVQNICKLQQLRTLDLLGFSDNFHDAQLGLLFDHLFQLRELSISGDSITDSILPNLRNLKFLRSLHFNAFTRFTFAGLQGYILNLAPTNDGLLLSIMSQDSKYNLNERKLATLRADIERKVKGKFEFVPFRESDSEYDGYETEFGGGLGD